MHESNANFAIRFENAMFVICLRKYKKYELIIEYYANSLKGVLYLVVPYLIEMSLQGYHKPFHVHTYAYM